ncbi:hypothetical protein NEOLEDRAFT_1127523 [Neolentinus lepideus HHB14362 ss-1]|uniref:Nucleoporin nup45 n=1 Tax=Neolentinus lepideus HHB14362 ss-1 TaxID=1314782 RepID=A0A165VIS9_9AGAM|nr:hypothetical protein NEOLEDRAFT_1127523 [Neolentinus lepideus HHB14362 ss-1]
MAFASSLSAFGMKPAATTSAPSLFGSTTAQPSGSIFGNTQQSQSQPSSLFGSTAQQQQPATSSLFGGTNQSQPSQQPATTGSLFGNTSTQPQQPATSGLFANTNTQAQQPTSSLFGNTNTSQQPTSNLFGNTAQKPTSSLFGNTTTQPSQPTSNLFGNTATQQPTSLFGSTATSNQPSSSNPLFGGGGSSLFGNTNTLQQQQGGSNLFGSANQQGGSGGGGLFGGSTAGANPLQAQATLPSGGYGSSLFGNTQQRPTTLQQGGGAPPFTKTTKFNDLPDQLKKTFEQIEEHIQGRVQISKGLKERDLTEETVKGQEQIRRAHKDLVNVLSTTRTDALQTRDLKAKVDQAVQDMIVTTRILEGFRNPQQHGAYLRDHAGFPLEFFQRITHEMKDRLQWYKSTIEQIERKLASASTQAQSTPQAISATLEAQHATFMSLANKTADLHNELQKIKAIYTQLWRAKTGSMRDPFDGHGTGVEV